MEHFEHTRSLDGCAVRGCRWQRRDCVVVVALDRAVDVVEKYNKLLPSQSIQLWLYQVEMIEMWPELKEPEECGSN